MFNGSLATINGSLATNNGSLATNTGLAANTGLATNTGLASYNQAWPHITRAGLIIPGLASLYQGWPRTTPGLVLHLAPYYTWPRPTLYVHPSMPRPTLYMPAATSVPGNQGLSAVLTENWSNNGS